MLDRLDEIIVAVSSAPGYGLMGIVRLSGPGAVALAARMCQTRDGPPLADRPASTRVPGQVLLDETLAIPAHFHLFRAPRSYTRQDLVEIVTIGAPAVLEAVRRRALALGARSAEPGEFTARAFVAGRMDLAAAEGVAAVIRARSDTQLRAARRMMDGALSQRIRVLRDEMAELLALVEADIDFAEEPIDFIKPQALHERLGRLRTKIQDLLAGPPSVERLDTLPRILLLGPPNAGKSALVNRLSGTSRAICAAAAGTTRDILSAPIRIGRAEAVLLDAAGIDQTADDIIAQARTLVLAEAERVDLVCVVTDLTAVDDDFFAQVAELDLPPVIVAANKRDLFSPAQLAEPLAHIARMNFGPVFPVSALTGEGADELRDGFAEALAGQATTAAGDALLITERQRLAVLDADRALARADDLAQSAAETIDCADLIAFELREALDALGTVTGEVTTDDLLGRVFADFCIGK